MKTERLRNWLIGLIVMVMLTIGIGLNYNGFVQAKNSCVNNNGTIIEQDFGLFSFNLSCEK
ncbi:hypothetical protein [Virgibacillus sediminis]|uniref:Uncharacterized protein n=1 Tax=Virgibacillus sediminis TaxID=202260 RepID=A0ABV7A1S5_9BACI